mmetsp:Transcript_7010/g.11723  ORF Transcript_7010/g.11723 Transcript_7010/m.11723 type:complete len:160 (-) Transcript_7010:833-1312(-)
MTNFLQGLAFFCCYAEHRQDYLCPQKAAVITNEQPTLAPDEHEDCLRKVTLEQEVVFNMGSIYRDMQLNHFAVEFFMKALALDDNLASLGRGTESAAINGQSSSSSESSGILSSSSCTQSTRLPLTSEAAHNLILIHKQSGNKSLALDIMKRYLVFGSI